MQCLVFNFSLTHWYILNRRNCSLTSRHAGNGWALQAQENQLPLFRRSYKGQVWRRFSSSFWKDGSILHIAEAGKESAPSACVDVLNIFTDGLICRPWCNNYFEHAIRQVAPCLWCKELQLNIDSIQKIVILTEQPHSALKLDVRADISYGKSQNEQKFDKEIKTRK